jgi:hypothetical protein
MRQERLPSGNRGRELRLQASSLSLALEEENRKPSPKPKTNIIYHLRTLQNLKSIKKSVSLFRYIDGIGYASLYGPLLRSLPFKTP